MNDELIRSANSAYQRAEQKADHYFKLLYTNVMQKSFVPTITQDIEIWSQSHVHYSLLTSFLGRNGNPDSKDYHKYIQWLDYGGKLDNYLDRSISYIYMRDLGKSLDSSDTQKRVRSVVDSIKRHLLSDQSGKTEKISMSWLYREAQKEGIELTLLWVLDKLKTVSENIPKGMDAENAQRKLIKIILGVTMYVIENMDRVILPKERANKLDEAIRLGYSYGLTYPFIDDILDAKILSMEEKKQYSDLIRTTLITGTVPELGEWIGNNKNLIGYIHSELRDAFEYIKAHQSPETMKTFLNQSYVFFHSQEIDREKELSTSNYTNEELYVPIILKSASSRLIVRSVIGAQEDRDFDNRTFYYGIYNQLADDFTDMFDDLKDGAVTPYTYYMKYRDRRPDLINPFELYWTVIANLIHNVYNSDSQTREVILDRAINSQKRFRERMGTEKYKEVMDIFASGNPKFNNLIQTMARKAEDIDFFDKLARDHMLKILRNERKEKEDFLDTIKIVRTEINNTLKISKDGNSPIDKVPIIDAANYSLEGDGKRLRPIITWVMGVNQFGLDKTAIVPLLRSLEYMHTASLIFDDLPSQDNAQTRRGRQTLHQLYSNATAELTGLFLTQKAVEEQASLKQFDPKTVLKLIRYSAKTVQDMCKGQVMDLNSKGKQLTLEQLNLMCFYKTGIAFEASILMPAILAKVNESEIDALKKFSYHAGIAFQIKDDLLDVEGDPIMLGKSIGRDFKNNSSTFITILGQEGSKKEMWEHYCLAMEALQEVTLNTTFLKHLLNYFVNRDH